MKTITVVLLIITLSATLLYAGNGDLIVQGKLGIGTDTISSSTLLHIQGVGSTSAPGSAFVNLTNTHGNAADQFGINFTNTSYNGTARINSYLDPGGATARLQFLTGGTTPTVAMTINGSGNVGIGTTMDVTGGSAALVFGNGTRPNINSSYAGIYARQDPGFNFTQLHVFDGYGHDSLISPHADDAPDSLYDQEDDMPIMVKEVQYFLGYVRYTNQTRAARLSGMTDFEKSALYREQRTCLVKETFDEHEARTGEKLTQLVWEEEQVRIKQYMDAQRQAAIDAKAQSAVNIDAKAQEVSAVNDAAKPALQEELAKLKQQYSTINVPEVYTMKPIPQRLRAALGK